MIQRWRKRKIRDLVREDRRWEKEKGLKHFDHFFFLGKKKRAIDIIISRKMYEKRKKNLCIDSPHQNMMCAKRWSSTESDYSNINTVKIEFSPNLGRLHEKLAILWNACQKCWINLKVLFFAVATNVAATAAVDVFWCSRWIKMKYLSNDGELLCISI